MSVNLERHTLEIRIGLVHVSFMNECLYEVLTQIVAVIIRGVLLSMVRRRHDSHFVPIDVEKPEKCSNLFVPSPFVSIQVHSS